MSDTEAMHVLINHQELQRWKPAFASNHCLPSRLGKIPPWLHQQPQPHVPAEMTGKKVSAAWIIPHTWGAAAWIIPHTWGASAWIIPHARGASAWIIPH